MIFNQFFGPCLLVRTQIHFCINLYWRKFYIRIRYLRIIRFFQSCLSEILKYFIRSNLGPFLSQGLTRSIHVDYRYGSGKSETGSVTSEFRSVIFFLIGNPVVKGDKHGGGQQRRNPGPGLPGRQQGYIFHIFLVPAFHMSITPPLFCGKYRCCWIWAN